MKRALLAGASLTALVVGGVLIAPSFFDWNQYKGEIVKQVKAASGLDVAIEGDIKLALLPAPKAMISGLTVDAPLGQEKTLLTLKRADVSVALAPLLQKKIVVENVRLIDPTVRVEKLADGRFSWETETIKAIQQNAADGKKGTDSADAAIAFDRIDIENGTFYYADRSAGTSQSLEKVSVSLKADSLKGPFSGKGTFAYNGKNVAFNGKSGAIKDQGDAFPVQLELDLGDKAAQLSFSGVADPVVQEIQGQVNFSTSSLSNALAGVKGNGATVPAGAFALSASVTASPQRVKIDTGRLVLDQTEVQWSAELTNLKDRKPVILTANFSSDDVVSLEALGFAPAQNDTGTAKISGAGNGGAEGGTAPLLPASLTLPFDLEADVSFALAGIKAGGQEYKGITGGVAKKGRAMALALDVQDGPGQMTLKSKTNLIYASSSSEPKTGAVTYTDPTLNFTAQGGVNSLQSLAKAYNIPLKDGASRLRTARFELDGGVKGQRITLAKSSVTIDQTSAVLSGFYAPSSQGRAKASLDVTADTVDFDQFIAPAKKPSGEGAPVSASSSKDGAKALAPLQSFSLPFDADFDISIQKAQFQGKALSGVRLQGAVDARSLSLKQAGVNDYMGAAIGLRGKIGDLATLSGLDLSFTGKTGDAPALLAALGIKAEGIPAQVKGAQVNADINGSLDTLTFAANVSAMQGQADAKGTVQSPLAKPQVENLELGIKHPDFAQAAAAFLPGFKAGPGLQQKIDLFAKVNQSGTSYTLSDITGTFGTTSVSGNVKLSLAGAKPDIAGALSLGNLPLDTYLGAPAAKKSSGAASGGGGPQKSGERWPKTPIDVRWIDAATVALDINAKNITYGAWTFTAPSTKVAMHNGTLAVDNLKAGVFGGQAVLSAKVSPLSSGGLSASLASSMNGAALEPLVTALSNSNRLKAQGSVDFTVDVKTAGGSMHALVGALGGAATLDGRSIVMEGFDLGQLARSLSADIKPGDSAQALLGGVRGGTTHIDTLEGRYDINNGIVSITSMIMDGPEAKITSKGNVSLPAWTIDTVHTISLKGATEDVPAFDVAIAGPLDNPGNTFGKGILQDFVQRKLERKLAKEAEKYLGDKVDGELGGALRQLGILPPAQQQAPQNQQPAAGETPQTPSAPAQQQAPQPQQNQQQPASPLDGLLDEGDDTERAIKGVLDGLLR